MDTAAEKVERPILKQTQVTDFPKEYPWASLVQIGPEEKPKLAGDDFVVIGFRKRDDALAKRIADFDYKGHYPNHTQTAQEAVKYGFDYINQPLVMDRCSSHDERRARITALQKSGDANLQQLALIWDQNPARGNKITVILGYIQLFQMRIGTVPAELMKEREEIMLIVKGIVKEGEEARRGIPYENLSWDEKYQVTERTKKLLKAFIDFVLTSNT